jgi:hypothetical protein
MAMKLTVDGLMRSLRGFAHDLADEIERGHAAELRREKPAGLMRTNREKEPADERRD